VHPAGKKLEIRKVKLEAPADWRSGYERAEAGFAQVETTPEQHAKNDWEVERLTGAQVGNSCAAKIGCQQDGAEDRGRWNRVEDRAEEQDGADGDCETGGES